MGRPRIRPLSLVPKQQKNLKNAELAKTQAPTQRVSSGCRHTPIACEGEYISVCSECGILLDRNLNGGEDYDNDGSFVSHTPSPTLHADVSDKKHRKIVEALQLTEIVRPYLSPSIFRAVHELTWDFVALDLKERIDWFLLVDCIAYYCANWHQQSQFYLIWHWGRNAHTLAFWHDCETLLIKHMRTLKHIFEYRVSMRESVLNLYTMGGLTGRALMKCVNSAPTQLKDLFSRLLMHYLDFINVNAPHLIQSDMALFFRKLCKFTKSKHPLKQSLKRTESERVCRALH